MSDPYGDAELTRYDQPVASRKWLIEILQEASYPLNFDELCRVTGTIRNNRFGLEARLVAMCRDGQIFTDRIGRYTPANPTGLVSGKVSAHRDGYGFFEPDESGESLYLNDRQMRKVYHGDRVLVSVRRPKRGSQNKSEARIVEVLEPRNRHIIGQFREQAGMFFVTPKDGRLHHEILIPEDQICGAKSGQFVVVELDQFPESNKQPVGHISSIVGDASDPGIEVQIAVHTHNLPYYFPEPALAEAASYCEAIDQDLVLQRLDLRELPFVTIDGEDAKDFDDAVCAISCGKGSWKLWVAIADVAHFVTQNSALDQAAIVRGTSVYFPSEVIPMLPSALSNELCSLKPFVDRLAIAVCLEIEETGNIASYRFHEIIMQSQQRLTYNQVQTILDSFHSTDMRARKFKSGIQINGLLISEEVINNIQNLFAVFRGLRSARKNRGALDFESTEPHFKFDECGKICGVASQERLEAHKLVEECMLSANVAAANCLKRYRIPALYRIHEEPTGERLEALLQFLGSIGLSVGGDKKPTPADYQALLFETQSRPDSALIQTLILRSMQQAKYAPDPDVGHFGLSYKHYTHFTSPIRRYPDLTVHRLLKWIIQGGIQDRTSHITHDGLPDMEQLTALGEHCSMTERRAEEASRDVGQWLKCQFMREKLGKEFNGTITGVAGFGLFILLDELSVEGMVHVTQLPADYWNFDEYQHTLTGERTHTVFRLADLVRVKVTRVDLESRRIDFSLADYVPASRKQKMSARSRLKSDKNFVEQHFKRSRSSRLFKGKRR